MNENDIVWIKENETNNVYCCELGKAHLDDTIIVYDVNCIIGAFDNITIPRARTFKNPVSCTMYNTVNAIHNGNHVEYLKVVSSGMACYDIEKL